MIKYYCDICNEEIKIEEYKLILESPVFNDTNIICASCFISIRKYIEEMYREKK